MKLEELYQIIRKLNQEELAMVSKMAMENDPALVLPTIEKHGYRRFTKVPPSDYTFKIEAFSLLLEIEEEKYQTNFFEAGGYMWRLVLCPNGNKKDGSKGYISLYLALAEPENLALGSEVNVEVNFFAFDQVHDRYMAVKDDDRKEWRFHKMKTEWGLNRFLSHDTLNDSSNGYLVDDCCIFGVEVLLLKSSNRRGESLSLVKDPPNSLFTWKFDYSRWDREFFYSDVFNVGGRKWKLSLYPRHKGTNLSLYLHLDSTETIPSRRKIFAKYSVRLKDQVLDNHFEKKAQHWFEGADYGWGFPSFISLVDLKNTSRGYLVNNMIIVEVTIDMMSSVKDFS